MAKDDRTQQVSLGCGTLILIALIVLIFGGGSVDDVKREVQRLRSTIGQLKTSIESQSDQIEALRLSLESMRAGTSQEEGVEKKE